jgi:archaellum component FlaC
MTTNKQKEIDFSLSDEEKNDLDQMIREFNQKRNTQLDQTEIDGVEQQLKTMQDRFEQLSDVILKMNARVDSLYEILQLMHQKSEILDAHINALRDAE